MRILFSIIFGVICFSMFGQVVSIAKNERTLISDISSIPNEASASDLIILDSNTRSLLPSSNIHLPYPVIFIHGLNSDFSVWHDQRDALNNGLAGLSFGGYYNYCLNYDGDNSTSNKFVYPTPGADIAYFNLENPIAADYYIVNFDIDNFGRLRYNSNFTDVLSNESAIAKQGRALKGIISMVLNLTGRNKVVLMGHSMGGLAAREYVQNPSNWQSDGQHHVAKLVTTGTPHGGYMGLNASFFTDINSFSEAYRDLRNYFNISSDSGVYLFGGLESYSVMNNNGFYIYDFYNVDVNCNGIDNDGSNVTGLNQRSWQNDLDYSYIIGHCTNCSLDGGGPGDGIVRSENANLSNFTSQLLTPHNEFIYTADAVSSLVGLHSDLPHTITENMKGLDEPNEYDLSYGIDFNIEYTGFISKPSNLGYSYDYDDYVFELPINASIELTTYSNYFVELPFRIINTQGVVYSGILSPNSSGSFFTQELSAGTYYLEFYMNANSIYDNSYEYPYKFELDIAPVVSMFTASTNTICVGECISFADNTSNSPNDWSWSFPGANTTVSNSQNPSNICYNTPGAYSVSLTTSNGYSTDNTTMTAYITVLAQPSSTITQNANTMSSSSPTGNQWYSNNTPISGATGQSFSPTASGTYYVLVTNSNGCSQMSAPFTFTYTPAPNAQFQANLSQVCVGECVVFTDNSSNQPTSWNWVFQGGTPSSSSSQSPNAICYQTPGTYFVSLTVSNAGGSDVQTSSGFITVTATPSIPTIASNGNQLSSSAGQGNQWYLNNTPISGATGQSFSPTASGTYYVQVTNSNGCSQMSAPFSFTYTPAPNAQFQANLSQVCVGECVVFSDNSNNSPTSWLWTFQGGTPATSSAQFPGSICYQTPGVYNVTLAVANAGGNDQLTYSGYITVDPLPSVPTISANGNTLSSSSNSGNQWYFNGNLMAGFNAPFIQATQSGNYSVIVTNSLGCSTSSGVFGFVFIDIAEESGLSEFSIFPNPTNGLVKVISSEKVVLIELFDISGKLLLATSELNFDISNFSDGIYLLHITTSRGTFNSKLIKTH